MQHNNWNLYLQNCMARGNNYSGVELVLMKGTLPEWPMSYSADDVNTIIGDRRPDWIARYSVTQQDFAFLGGVNGTNVEERDGKAAWGTQNFLYESDMDNNADRLRTSLQADKLERKNPALPTDAVTLPTWFVLVSTNYGPGEASDPSGHVVKLVGKVSSHSQLDTTALLTLRSEPAAGQVPLVEEIGPVKLPF